MRVVGLDCATDDERIGLALGEHDAGVMRVTHVTACSRERTAAPTVAEWFSSSQRGLLAVDAPLGWPAGLRTALATHKAGDAIAVEPHQMFRRQTDLFVHEHIGKTPLDVGADRIARTAHAALRILGELRTELGLQMPLCWNSDDVHSVEVIEVYPAATLSARGIRSSGYKKPEQSLARQEVAAALDVALTLDVASADIATTGDTLDSVVCLLAAKDFLDGRAVPPENRALASQEGWIWVPAEVVKLRPRAGTPSGYFASAGGSGVMCPACGLKNFKSWPSGWDAHAAHKCPGVQGTTPAERKNDFRNRFLHGRI
jgi:predicted nuclease with RNAse H fold